MRRFPISADRVGARALFLVVAAFALVGLCVAAFGTIYGVVCIVRGEVAVGVGLVLACPLGFAGIVSAFGLDEDAPWRS